MLATRTELPLLQLLNDYSDYTTPPLSSSRSSYLELQGSFSNITLPDSFPIIDCKYLNKSISSESIKTHKSIAIVNQSNINNKKVDENDDNDDKEERHSKIFIKDRSAGQIYVLEFKAIDIQLIPVYLKHRTFEDNKNDKCIQPRSTSIYENTYNKKSRRFSQLLRSYKIDKSLKNEGKLSVMSFKKPLLEKRRTFPPEPKPKPSISDPVSNLKQSIIYLTCGELDFKINPGLMNLKSSSFINFEEEQNREKLLKELKMALPGDFKNKAQIIVKHKGDILKFIFKLSEINCNKLKVTSSVGIMAKDDSVYVKEFSSISNRKIYIAVPKSNYEYLDVMLKQRHQNRTMKFNKIDPIWLVEQRKKRYKEYNQCRVKNPYDDILELKIGSSLCYESFNSINKVKGGTLPCSVSDEEYERWVENIQRSQLPPLNDNDGTKFESSFAGDIPDWNLVMNAR